MMADVDHTVALALGALASAITALVGILTWGLRFGLRKLFGRDSNGDDGAVGTLIKTLEGVRIDLHRVDARIKDNTERIEQFGLDLREAHARAAQERKAVMDHLDAQSLLLRAIAEKGTRGGQKV